MKIVFHIFLNKVIFRMCSLQPALTKTFYLGPLSVSLIRNQSTYSWTYLTSLQIYKFFLLYSCVLAEHAYTLNNVAFWLQDTMNMYWGRRHGYKGVSVICIGEGSIFTVVTAVGVVTLAGLHVVWHTSHHATRPLILPPLRSFFLRPDHCNKSSH